MISLSRHIELLLLEHDCVIVPGLGGFIANYAEAQYDSDGDLLFLPPYRTIRFNQQLQMNDGLLVQSYMAAYDASYPAAYLQMEKDIEKVVYELETNGEFLFDKIGVLKKEINHRMSFIPSETSVLTPSLYGLYSYEIKSLSSAIKEREVKEALNTASAMAVSINGANGTEREAANGGGKGNSKRISKRWIDVGISVAASIVLLFCFSYQALRNTVSDTDTVVAAFYATDVEDVRHVAENKPVTPSKVVKTKDVNEKPVGEEAPAEAVAEELPTETATDDRSVEKTAEAVPADAENQEATFAIVLASFVNKTNAEAFIENLAKQGFAEGRYVKNENVSRILYSSYKDRAEARRALEEFRQKNDRFEKAWILEL